MVPRTPVILRMCARPPSIARPLINLHADYKYAGMSEVRLSLPETTVREAVDVLSPSLQPTSNPTAVRVANSNPALVNSSTRRIEFNSHTNLDLHPQRVDSAVLDPNIISVIGPEFTSERPVNGHDCPQCGLNSNNIVWYNGRRNSDQCDTQGERMCTISKFVFFSSFKSSPSISPHRANGIKYNDVEIN